MQGIARPDGHACAAFVSAQIALRPWLLIEVYFEFPFARLISSSDAGFSNAEVSPSFSPRNAARTTRRITFAFRVWYVADENDFTRGECFAELGGERVF